MNIFLDVMPLDTTTKPSGHAVNKEFKSSFNLTYFKARLIKKGLKKRLIKTARI